MRGRLAHPLVDLGLRHLLQLEPERHVVEHAHVRVERVVLEHHGDVALLRRHVVDDAVADADRALRDHLEPGDHAQRRGLAAARRADEHHELAVGDVEVEGADRLGAVGVDLPDVLEDDLSHGPSSVVGGAAGGRPLDELERQLVVARRRPAPSRPSSASSSSRAPR